MKRSIRCFGIIVYGLAIGFSLGHKCYADFILLRGEVVCIDCDLRSENAATRSWGATERGFQTSLYVSNQIYAVGEPILASAALRNTLDHPIPFDLPSTLAIFALSVTNPHGKPATLTDYGQRQAHGTFTGVFSERLSSQGILKIRYPLDKLFDMSMPGKYFVTARFGMPVTKTTNQVYAISNTVTVEIASATSGEPKGK